MSTQLLFGDLFEILEISGPWLNIRNQFDGIEGWIDFKQITFLEKEQFISLLNVPVHINRHHLLDFMTCGTRKIHLPAGCSVIQNEEGQLDAGGEPYVFHGSLYPFVFSSTRELISTAEGYLDSPYQWGGMTCLGIDCSGFTQMVFKQHGIKLLRNAVQQATQGELINLLSEGNPGDLAFFDRDDGIISHVGILLDQSRVIHCSGRVRIDPIDHYGIYNTDLKKYTHALRLIRRMVNC